jgi:hypothetical protein
VVGKLNLHGDGQGDVAGHGGEQRAVFVYQIESYRYWQEQLRRAHFVYGQFGENFTVDSLPDDSVYISDRYGSAAPCSRSPSPGWPACDVPVRWACRTGVCHNCESGLVSREVAYDPQPLDLPATGNLLIYCSHPAGDVVVDL